MDNDAKIRCKVAGCVYGRASEYKLSQFYNVPMRSAAETVEMVVVQFQTGRSVGVGRTAAHSVPDSQSEVFRCSMYVDAVLYFFKDIHMYHSFQKSRTGKMSPVRPNWFRSVFLSVSHDICWITDNVD